MKGIEFLPGFIGSLLISGLALPAFPQVTSDNTTNTTVNQSNNNFNILNGIQKGNNLFHSFKEFSIPKGGSATFNNSTDVVNIINRVTGGNISNIDGLIKASGNANLFLINPAGITFGENASLDIGGSFLGSTAESILFEDRFNYSAVNPQNESLLTISVPMGLQMGINSGNINAKGNGHQLISQSANLSPYINPGNANSLEVKPGKTLALVGGDIILDGAIIKAEAGRIELTSLKEGEVSLIQSLQGFELGDAEISNSGNIQLSQKALIDVSGAGTAFIKIQGDSLSIADGSVVMMQNRGIQPAGDITVNAKSIELNGSVPNSKVRSSLMSETIAGNTGNINIKTERLKIADGAALFNRTFGLGNNGLINIDAAESIEITGVSAIDPNKFSAIASATFSTGNSGNIQLSTKNLSVLDGAIITGTTFGKGSAGNININSEITQVAGSNQSVFFVSTITASTFDKGNAGNINIDTQTLSIKDSGTINTTSHNSGNSGNITIDATKLVELTGGNPVFMTNINSSVLPERTSLGQLLRLPKLPTGNVGNMIINTPSLKVEEYGYIAVENKGTGNAGKLQVNADIVKLENIGLLIARSNSGEGGNIFVEADSLKLNDNSLITTEASGGGDGGNITINTRNSLVMRRNSKIDTESLSKGNGGNININSPVISGFENSDIIANAVEGNGGNINITTQGIFGLEFRDELTSESDITASSQFGINGTVDIKNFGIDPSSGLVELDLELADSSQQIASGCSSNTENTFVSTGRGGIPINPNEQVDANLNWSDIRDLSELVKPNHNTVKNTQISNKPAIVEATGFLRNQNGEIELIASGNTPFATKQVSECSRLNT